MFSTKRLPGLLHPAALCLLALGLALTGANALADSAAVRNGYEYYQVGDLKATRPGATEPALLLMGGGEWPHQAFAWLAAKGGHGHFLILRASGDDDLQKELYHDVGGVASVQTLVFHSRAAASDPRVLEIVRRADGIFIAGGDQANYVRFWKGTPLNALLDQHVAAGKPIGGSSAGLAILGGHAYGATYPGPIGAALNPGMMGVEQAAHHANASTFCGRCAEVCPVKIPLPAIMRHWRAREHASGLAPKSFVAGLGVWAFFAKRPALYRAITGIAARFLKMVGGRRGHIAALPLPRGWFAVRDLPAPQGKTFHELWKARQ